MSSLMAKFFANTLPYIAMLWSVVLLLFYRTLYRDLFGNTDFSKVIPPLAAVVLAGILLILPIRTCINKCHAQDFANATEQYDQVFADFPTDYDRENPVTKNEGLLRIMEKKISSASSEEEKLKLRAQMTNVKQATAMDAFKSYAM